jgi:hypothetical protein
MRKIIFSTLLSFTSLLGLERPVLSQKCPILDVTEIMVRDRDATLKVNPLTSPALGPVINANDILLIAQPSNPISFNGLCYYPIYKDNQFYWISQEGVKDFSNLFTSSRTSTDSSKTTNKSLQSTDINHILKASTAFFSQELIRIFADILFIVFLSTVSLVGILQRKNVSDAIQSIIKLNSYNDFFTENHQLTKIFIEFQEAKLKNDTELLELIKEFKLYIYKNYQPSSRNTQYEQALHLFEQVLDKHLQILSSLQDKSFNQNEDIANSEDNHPDQITPEHNHTAPLQKQDSTTPSQVESASNSVIEDSFYNEVISNFNILDIEWFEGLINDKAIFRVQIHGSSVTGDYDDGEKVTKLERDDKGTLLIYKALHRFWLIPDLTQPRWRRAVTNTFFAHSDKKTLERPAEIIVLENDNNLLKLFKIGKFS